MSETTKTEEPREAKRDFSKPDTHVCEVARFDNDGHLSSVKVVVQHVEEGGAVVDEKVHEFSIASEAASTNHPDAE